MLSFLFGNISKGDPADQKVQRTNKLRKRKRRYPKSVADLRAQRTNLRWNGNAGNQRINTYMARPELSQKQVSLKNRYFSDRLEGVYVNI